MIILITAVTDISINFILIMLNAYLYLTISNYLSKVSIKLF
jgi:hypothetical protein